MMSPESESQTWAVTRAISSPTIPACQPDKLPALFAALAQAVTDAQPVAKDSQTQAGPKYRYASSEVLYEEGRAALAKHGLTLIPLSQVPVVEQGFAEPSPAGRPAEGESQGQVKRVRNLPPLWLERSVMLAHKDGGFLVCHAKWPILPENGRPVDKQFAAMLTTSLAYLVRDLLLLPRVSEEMDRGEKVEKPKRCKFADAQGRCRLAENHEPRPHYTLSPELESERRAQRLQQAPQNKPRESPSKQPLAASSPQESPSPPPAVASSSEAKPAPKPEAKAESRSAPLPDRALTPGELSEHGQRQLTRDEREEAQSVVGEILLGDADAIREVWSATVGVFKKNQPLTFTQADQAIKAAQARRDQMDAAKQSKDAAQPVTAGEAPAPDQDAPF